MLQPGTALKASLSQLKHCIFILDIVKGLGKILALCAKPNLEGYYKPFSPVSWKLRGGRGGAAEDQGGPEKNSGPPLEKKFNPPLIQDAYYSTGDVIKLLRMLITPLEPINTNY